MFWRHFPTQAAAREAIREIIRQEPFKVPFESALISDLIEERHYFCSPRGLRPSRFRKLPGGNPYIFQGDFSNCVLDRPVDWHTVSWDKCLKPPTKDWDRIVRAMRDRSEPIKVAYRRIQTICELCGIRTAEEVHHESPTFVELSDTIRLLVSDSDIADCLAGWDWFAEDNFRLPENHKITLLFDDRHSRAVLQSLCKSCHNSTKKGVRRRR